MSLFLNLFKSKKFDKAKNFQQFLFEDQIKKFDENFKQSPQAGTTNEKGQVLKESSHPGWLRWQTPDLFSATANKPQREFKPAEKDLTQLETEFEDTSPKDLFDKVDNHLSKKQELREFKDFNKRVPGSRKELAAIKKLSASELLKEDSITQYEYIKKDILIPPLDAQKLRDNGENAGLVYLKLKLRENIVTRPIHTDTARKVFVEILPEVIKDIDNSKNLSELISVFPKYFVKSIRTHNGQMRDDVFFSKEALDLLESRGVNTDTEVMVTASEVFGNRFFSLLRKSSSATQRLWRFAQQLTVKDDWSLLIDSWTIADGIETELNKAKEKSALHIFPKLDRVIRKNGREVTEEEINPENMHSELGYNAVVFGNYMDNQSAREHVKFFIGAMKDLEDVLGIDLKKINQKGHVNIAFGAFGGGNSNTNYKPLKTLINITKSRGDGSVAHEWGNFLNHFLAGARTDVTSVKEAFATESIAKEPAIRKPLKAIISEITDPANTWYKNSSALKSGLFKKPHEMFARAFESFVQDELQSRAMYNNYLVRDNKTDADNSIYPQGEERERSNRLFKDLFSTIVEVYGRNESSENQSKRISDEVKYSDEPAELSLFKKSISMRVKLSETLKGILRKAKKKPKDFSLFPSFEKPEEHEMFSPDQLFDGMEKDGKRLEPSYKNPLIRRFHKKKEIEDEQVQAEPSPDLFTEHYDKIYKPIVMFDGLDESSSRSPTKESWVRPTEGKELEYDFSNSDSLFPEPNLFNTAETEQKEIESDESTRLEIELEKILLPFKKLAESEPLQLEENILELNPVELKALAYEEGKKLRGKYLNIDTGELFTVNRTSIKKVISHEFYDVNHLLSVTSIPKIIERGIFISEVPNEKIKPKNFAKSYKYFLCGMKIKDEDYTIKSVIIVTPEGESYYDHSLTKIEKGKLLRILDTAVSITGELENLPFNDVKDTRIFTIMQEKKDEILKLFSGNKKNISINQFKSTKEAENDEVTKPPKLSEKLNRSIIEGKVMNLNLKKSIENDSSQKVVEGNIQSATYLDQFLGQDGYKPIVPGIELITDIQTILNDRFQIREVPESSKSKEYIITKDFGTLNILVSSKGEVVIKFKDSIEMWPDIFKNSKGIFVLNFHPWSEIALAISRELGISNKDISITDDQLEEIVKNRDSIRNYRETIENNELASQALEYIKKRETLYFSIDPDFRWVNFIDEDLPSNLCYYIQNQLSAELAVLVADKGRNAILEKAEPADDELISFIGREEFKKRMVSGRNILGYSTAFLLKEAEKQKNKQRSISFFEVDNKIFI
ncbi:hypothetical protein MASR1M107_05640 [Ignavibacteriales bacterium]